MGTTESAPEPDERSTTTPAWRRSMMASSNHPGPPSTKTNLKPILQLSGMILGMGQSGKRTLLQRLEGKDPFAGSKMMDHHMERDETLVKYQPPSGQSAWDRIQLRVQVARSIDEIMPATPVVADFCVVLVNPRHDRQRIQDYLMSTIRAYLELQGYHHPTSDESNNNNDNNTQTLRPFCICLLLNFRDLPKNDKDLQQSDLLQLTRQALADYNVSPEADHVILQCGNVSLRNCFGLPMLHQFIYHAYLQRKKYDAQTLLRRVTAALTTIQSVPRQQEQSYEDFVALLESASTKELIEGGEQRDTSITSTTDGLRIQHKDKTNIMCEQGSDAATLFSRATAVNAPPPQHSATNRRNIVLDRRQQQKQQPLQQPIPTASSPSPSSIKSKTRDEDHLIVKSPAVVVGAPRLLLTNSTKATLESFLASSSDEEGNVPAPPQRRQTIPPQRRNNNNNNNNKQVDSDDDDDDEDDAYFYDNVDRINKAPMHDWSSDGEDQTAATMTLAKHSLSRDSGRDTDNDGIISKRQETTRLNGRQVGRTFGKNDVGMVPPVGGKKREQSDYKVSDDSTQQDTGAPKTPTDATKTSKFGDKGRRTPDATNFSQHQEIDSKAVHPAVGGEGGRQAVNERLDYAYGNDASGSMAPPAKPAMDGDPAAGLVDTNRSPLQPKSSAAMVPPGANANGSTLLTATVYAASGSDHEDGTTAGTRNPLFLSQSTTVTPFSGDSRLSKREHSGTSESRDGSDHQQSTQIRDYPQETVPQTNHNPVAVVPATYNDSTDDDNDDEEDFIMHQAPLRNGETRAAAPLPSSLVTTPQAVVVSSSALLDPLPPPSPPHISIVGVSDAALAAIRAAQQNFETMLHVPPDKKVKKKKKEDKKKRKKKDEKKSKKGEGEAS